MQFKLSALYSWLKRSGLNTEATELEQAIKYAGIREDLIAQYPQFQSELMMASAAVKPSFLRWVVLQLNNQEPINEITNMVGEFEKFRPRLVKKDIYQYATLGDLRGEIEAGGKSNAEKRKELKKNIDGAYDIIYSDKNYLVVHPHTKAASCYFGQGTKWCVAATVSTNYFLNYSARGVFLYYIISKNPINAVSSLNKIAYAYTKDEKNEIFDEQDRKISENDVENHLNESFDKINGSILNHLRKQKDTKFNELLTTLTADTFAPIINEIKDEEERVNLIEAMSQSSAASPDVLGYVVNNFISKEAIIDDISIKIAARYFAKNQKTPGFALDHLSKIVNVVSIRYILQHPNVLPETVEYIFNEKGEQVLHDLLLIPACPDSIFNTPNTNIIEAKKNLAIRAANLEFLIRLLDDQQNNAQYIPLISQNRLIGHEASKTLFTTFINKFLTKAGPELLFDLLCNNENMAGQMLLYIYDFILYEFLVNFNKKFADYFGEYRYRNFILKLIELYHPSAKIKKLVNTYINESIIREKQFYGIDDDEPIDNNDEDDDALLLALQEEGVGKID